MVVKVLLLGHSFIYHYREFLRKNRQQFSYSLNLDPRTCMVQYSGIRGGTLSTVWQKQMQAVQDFELNIVVLQIGSNDLTSNNETPDSVSDKILLLIHHLTSTLGVHRVNYCNAGIASLASWPPDSLRSSVGLVQQTGRRPKHIVTQQSRTPPQGSILETQGSVFWIVFERSNHFRWGTPKLLGLLQVL